MIRGLQISLLLSSGCLVALGAASAKAENLKGPAHGWSSSAEDFAGEPLQEGPPPPIEDEADDAPPADPAPAAPGSEEGPPPPADEEPEAPGAQAAPPAAVEGASQADVSATGEGVAGRVDTSVALSPPALASDRKELEYPGYVPGYRGWPAVGLSQHAPAINPPMGGTTPSFGSKIRPQTWIIGFQGSLWAEVPFGLGTSSSTGGTTIHVPSINADGSYATPGYGGDFGFVMSQGPLVARVRYGWGLSPSLFSVDYNPAIIPDWGVQITFGRTGRNFGGSDAGGGGGLFGTTVGIDGDGFQFQFDHQLNPYLGILLIQGVVMGPTGTPPRNDGGSWFGHFWGVEANYDGIFIARVGYVNALSQDGFPTKPANDQRWLSDEQLHSAAADFHWFGEELGEVGLGVQYTKMIDGAGPVWTAPSGEGSSFRGDYGRYLAWKVEPSLWAFQTQYGASVFRMIDPSFYDPDGRDLRFTVGAYYTHPSDPYVGNPAEPPLELRGGEWGVGVDVSYRIFPVLSTSGGYRYRDPSTASELGTSNLRYSEIWGSAELKTSPLSPEYIRLEWTHRFLEMPRTNPAPDTDVFELTAGIYW